MGPLWILSSFFWRLVIVFSGYLNSNFDQFYRVVVEEEDDEWRSDLINFIVCSVVWTVSIVCSCSTRICSTQCHLAVLIRLNLTIGEYFLETLYDITDNWIILSLHHYRFIVTSLPTLPDVKTFELNAYQKLLTNSW